MDKKTEADVTQELVGANVPKFKGSLRPQYIAGLIATIITFNTGNMLGWSSPAIPDIKEDFDANNKTMINSDDDESWVGSTAMLGSLVAGLLAGYFIDLIGRKHTTMGTAIIMLGGWILLACSNSLGMLIAGRFITGFGGGCLAVPVYISEIAVTEIRGSLGNTMVLVLVSGILFVYVVGALVSWVWTSIICGVIPVIFFVAMFFMPESPRYLLMKGRREDAASSLKWLRGASSTKEIEPELQEMEISVKESQAQAGGLKDLFTLPVARPTLISLMLMFLQQFGGINVVLFYSVDVFQSAGSDLDANVSSIIIATVQVVFCFVSTLLVDRAGRKILVVISDLGMALSLTALGVFFYLKSEGKDEGLGWLPLVSLIAYIITYNLGLGPLPWLLMSELVPSHVKGAASAICTATCWGLGFVVTKTFSDMEKGLQTHGCYWLFAGISAAGGLWALLFVPETKGKSLDEIQKQFQ